jgi:hypothetical protein
MLLTEARYPARPGSAIFSPTDPNPESGMAAAVQFESGFDDTRVSRIVRGGFVLALVEAVFVVIVSIINKSVDGTADHLLTLVVVAVGAMIVMFYPGMLTRPRTIEGIAGAAGVGQCATFVFVLLDAFLLQPLHFYTNRWHEIGGGSIWWYIPVWWMAGTFLAWMGGWTLANLANKNGEASLPTAIVLVAVSTAVIGAVAALLHFPGAAWTVPTFVVAMLPGVAVAAIVSSVGARRA